MASVLIIDDSNEPGERFSALESIDIECKAIVSPEEAIALARNEDFDAFIVSMESPEFDLSHIMAEMVRSNDHPPIIMIIRDKNPLVAMEATFMGAFDCLQSGFTPEELLVAVTRALKYKQLQKENTALRRQVKNRYDFPLFTGVSELSKQLYRQLKNTFESEETVLIIGERGMKKTSVAKTIHFNSRRDMKPFMVVDCSAVPESLLEADFFGSEADGHRLKPGKLELASGGTVFLEDLDKLSAELAHKVFKTLRDKTFRRIDGSMPYPLDVRIICSSRRMPVDPLFTEFMAEQGAITLELPPLRDRQEDVPVIFESLLTEKAMKAGLDNAPRVSPEANQVLRGYDWPGNIAEMQGLVSSLIAIKKSDTILSIDLPRQFFGKGHVYPPAEEERETAFAQDIRRLPLSGINLPEFIDDLERDLILQALDRARGVKTKAAELLGIKRTTLTEKMKKKNMM